jgi:asparagine synthase (glutamine-hydrolysing)
MTRRNVTVALSGDGGDENFSGYERYISGMFEEHIRKHVPTVFLDLLFRGIKGIVSPYVRGYTRIENMTLPLHAAAGNTFFCFDDKIKKKLFSEAFQRRIHGHRSIDVLEGYFKRADGLDPLSRLQYVDLVSYLPEDILMKVDRMSMAHSLEVRAPLLDYRIVEFASTLPGEWKIRGGTGKVFLRQAVKGLIPEKVLNRSKMGFGAPVGDWFRGRLQCLMEAVLFDERTVGRGYFETDFIRSLWERHLRGPAWQIDLSHLLWVLIILELWHRLFVDGDTVEDLGHWIERVAGEKYS